MELPNAFAMRVFPVEKRAEEEDPSRAIIHMPVGCEPFALILHGNGLAVCAVLPAVMGPRVAHPVLVLQPDVPVMPLIARRLGAPIGGVVHYAGVPVAVMPELPWPTHAEKANG